MKRIISILLTVLLIISAFGMTSCEPVSKTDRTTDIVNDTEPPADDITTDEEESQEPDNKEDSENEPDSETSPETFDVLPAEYTEVADDYKKIVKYRLSPEFSDGWDDGILEICEKYSSDIQGDFYNMIIEMMYYIEEPTVSSYGYILKDLNDDGLPEMIWVSQGYEFVFAIFTIDDGEVKLLDAFWSRYKCVIGENGEICTMGSGGAAYTVYQIKSVDKDGLIISVDYEFGTDYNDETAEVIYYEVSNGEKAVISRERYDALLAEYPFENGMTESVQLLEEDKYYYLSEISRENLVAVKIPDIGEAELINSHINSVFSERYGLPAFALSESETVSDELWTRFNDADYSEYYMELDGRIEFENEEIYSIVFEGLCNYKNSAHPMHMFFTLNIDKKSGERLLFADKYDVNEDLYELFSAYAQADIDEIVGEGVISVKDMLCPYDRFVEAIAEEMIVCTYYTDDNIGISYEVNFAMGGHIEVEIPIEEFESFVKS